jgi:hypothetical protein
MIQRYHDAGFPAVAITTSEEERLERLIVEELGQNCKIASVSATGGLRDVRAQALLDDKADYRKAFAWASKAQDNVLIVYDFQHVIRNAGAYRSLKDQFPALKANGSMVVLVAPSWSLPLELEHDLPILELPLPTRDQLDAALRIACEGIKINGKVSDLLDAAAGLALQEAENTFALASLSGDIDQGIVTAEKMRLIKSSGYLEVFPAVDPRLIGGLDNYKMYMLGEALPVKGDPDLAVKGILFVGIPGCIAGDTELTYLRGSRKGGRTIKLADFYHKFNGLPTSTRPWEDITMPTFLHSMDGERTVFYNRVVSVLEAGIKPLLKMTFDDGSHLRLTENHPIATPNGFMAANSLTEGDIVLARGSMKPISEGGRDLSLRPPRILVNVKYHPYGAYKEVAGYEYTRVARARLLVEARMNGIDYAEFVHCLKHNEERSRTLRFLPQEMEVHHMDEDTLNDDLGNLMVLSKPEHARIHGKTENFNCEYLREVRVCGIEMQPAEMTYDIQMDYPANNFAANGIIVHNTGKSLCSKAAGALLGWPVLRADVGALKGSLVGQSEANMRGMLKLADAVAPCILWLDEIEKGIGGYASSANTDSGVTLGMVGTLLTWMQEHSSSVLTIATCNDYRKLPPELTRAGRFDERFFVDLPNLVEREEIAKVHLGRLNISGDLIQHAADIAVLTDTWTGAEIEQLVKSAARRTQRKLTLDSIKEAAATIKPLAKVDPEGMEALRRWGRECMTLANSPEEQKTSGRKVKR